MISCTCIAILGVLYLVHVGELRSTSMTDYPIATTVAPIETTPKTRYEQGLEDYDEEQRRMKKERRRGRGMFDDDDNDDDYADDDNYMLPDHDKEHDHHKEEEMEMKEEEKAVKADPWAGYYDFIITEGSFKFWAAFQLATALLLIYSALAAVYYAKLNPIAPDYDYYDDFFGRSDSGTAPASKSWISMDTVQRILDAISSKKYA